MNTPDGGAIADAGTDQRRNRHTLNEHGPITRQLDHRNGTHGAVHASLLSALGTGFKVSRTNKRKAAAERWAKPDKLAMEAEALKTVGAGNVQKNPWDLF